MKYLLTAAFIVILSAPVKAQTYVMRDAFKQMPDSVLPYLSGNNRLDFIDFIDSNMKSEVDNAFYGRSQMKTLTDDYLFIQLSASSSVEMKLLQYAKAVTDSTKNLICVVTTFGENKTESTIDFYGMDWRKIRPTRLAEDYAVNFINRPDTMSMEHYENLCRLVAGHLAVAQLSPSDNSLTVSASLPMLSAEEKKQVEPILSSMTLKWDGENFK